MMRGSGRTTEQMKDAPKGAIFVWGNHHFQYPTALARSLARGDLRIIGPDDLRCRLAGLDLPIVVDHAADLTAGQWDALNAYTARLRLRESSGSTS